MEKHEENWSYETQGLLLTQKMNECYELIEQSEQSDSNSSSQCPTHWDQIMCWPQGIPGQLSNIHCPSYIYGFNSQAYASRYCFENGTWLNFTNFQSCSNSTKIPYFVKTDDEVNSTLMMTYLPTVKTLSHVGYGVSELALIIAFIILLGFKKLRCPRNMLHLHLFVSFIMRGFMGFLKSSLFEQGVGLRSNFALQNGTYLFVDEQEENWECKTLTTIWQYFLMANYSWILMEGLYIHNLIMFALFSDTSDILIYILLGWGLPLIFISYWALARAFTENTLCWTTNKHVENYLIIRVPVIVSITINFLLFLNIVRLILVKVRTSIQEDTERYWKWAKSTLVLVPLFGIHYMFFLLMSLGNKMDDRIELAWLFCDQFFGSFQGFFVAVLYCFVNREVQEVLKSSWTKLTNNNRAIIDQTMSFGSRSSTSSMKQQWNILRAWRRFRFKRKKYKTNCQRTETIDCIVCESCPIGPVKQHHSHQEVELTLIDRNCGI